MCLIVFAYKMHADYPLLLAGNRDEFYRRPAKPARIWETKPALIAGQDLQAGGTWAGINENGRISFITNYRDIKNLKESAPSRGHIVKDSLLSNEQPIHFLHGLKHHASVYNGFNLLSGSVDSLYWFNNIREKIVPLEPGFYGISNAFINTPWPKITSVKQAFELIFYDNLFEPAPYFNILLNPETYHPSLLPDTGLSPEMEKAVSAAFIQTEEYGTRSSTFLRIHKNGNILFEERNYLPGTAEITSQNRFEGNSNEKKLSQIF